MAFGPVFDINPAFRSRAVMTVVVAARPLCIEFKSVLVRVTRGPDTDYRVSLLAVRREPFQFLA